MVRINAERFDTSVAALARASEQDRLVAIQHADMLLVVDRRDLDRAESAGMKFAYLASAWRADGERVIVTIPVNEEA